MFKQVINNAKAEVIDNSLNNADDPVTFQVTSGLGERFPDSDDGEFFITAYRPSQYPDPFDDPEMEVLLVTERADDEFTAERNASYVGGLHSHTEGTDVRLLVMAEHIKELQDGLESLLYVDLAISTFTNDQNAKEKGQTVTQILFNWTYNTPTDPVNYQSIDQGVGEIPVPELSKLITGLDITTDITYILTASNGVTTPDPTKSTSIYFRNKRYWGINPNDTIDNDGILALSGELSTSRLMTKTFDCSGNEPEGNYIYICYPKAWGQGETWLNGFKTEFQESEIEFTNAYGYIETYYIYRSPNPYNGDEVVVEVK